MIPPALYYTQSLYLILNFYFDAMSFIVKWKCNRNTFFAGARLSNVSILIKFHSVQISLIHSLAFHLQPLKQNLIQYIHKISIYIMVLNLHKKLLYVWRSSSARRISNSRNFDCLLFVTVSSFQTKCIKTNINKKENFHFKNIFCNF